MLKNVLVILIKESIYLLIFVLLVEGFFFIYIYLIYCWVCVSEFLLVFVVRENVR